MNRRLSRKQQNHVRQLSRNMERGKLIRGQTKVGPTGQGRSSRPGKVSSTKGAPRSSNPDVGALLQGAQDWAKFINELSNGTMDDINAITDQVRELLNPGQTVRVMINKSTGKVIGVIDPNAPVIRPGTPDPNVVEVTVTKPEISQKKNVCSPPKKRFSRKAFNRAAQSNREYNEGHNASAYGDRGYREHADRGVVWA
ncbi:hypothetical protein [Kordiimonas aquimaris]|uniref:hypothetical protein n=1 Tax=Kordiimonas aquimaris TaxID=707591 RepID=UPI0021D21EE1|nr:hypothetical protein [Kordiimonas aquimaris]